MIRELTNYVDIGIYVGRFSPFHKGHEVIVRNALEKCQILIICLGSHSRFRTQKDPFLASERIEIIKSCFADDELKRIKFYPLINYHAMDLWITDIELCINNFKSHPDQTVGIFGCIKDESSLYLKCFPSYFRQMFLNETLYSNLSSTDIRRQYFVDNVIDESHIPQGVCKYLKQFKKKFKYSELPEK